MKLVTDTPHSSIVTATKPLVDALLALNTRNRKVRRTAVERLCSDMESGDWLLTASGVGVDTDGVLSDGQHRLHAIVMAGYPPVQFLLVTGLKPEAQAVVDRHAKRSLADALSLVSGRTISTNMIAANNILLTIKNSTSRSQSFSHASRQPSDAQAAASLMLWEDDLSPILQSAGGSLRSSVIAALAVYHRHEPEKALELCDQVKRGACLNEHDPAYKLRIALSQPSLKGGGSANSLRAFGYTVSAIVAHSQGRQLKLLKGSESWDTAPWKEWKA